MTTPSKEQDVYDALQELNLELSDSGNRVKCFYLEYDDALKGWSANLIWLVKSLTSVQLDEESEENQTDLLLDIFGIGADKLRDIVVSTHCDYRTDDDFNTQYGKERWTGILIELPNVA